VLERENFIKSTRDGNLKRFYVATAKVTTSKYLSSEELRKEMSRIITARPGISQRELIEEVGYSRDSVGYHLREMVSDGTIRDARKGKYTTYYPKGTRR
jgi:predicted transcriptional regulator